MIIIPDRTRNASHVSGVMLARLDLIVTRVTDACGTNREDLFGPRRTARIARARHIAMWLARSTTDLSLIEIGEYFGGRDHGTVTWAGKKVAAWMAANDPVVDSIRLIERQVLQTFPLPAGSIPTSPKLH